MDTTTEKRLKQLHPKLSAKVKEIIEAMALQGIEMRVVQGLRTYEEQNILYAQGRTRKGPKVTNAKGGQSYHNFALAADLCPFKDGKPQWENANAFGRLGAVCRSVGLEWGGNWPRFPDRPHVQLQSVPTLAICRQLYAQGGVAKVIASV